MSKAQQFICVMVFICKTSFSFAQVSPPATDTMRIIQIIHANSYREKTIDSVTKLEILVGNVLVNEGTTKFSCDSAIVNKNLNTMEAFGNVHINQSDSLFTSSQYIKYLANDRMAYLKKDVKLSDKKGGTLFTQELEYDLKTGTGKYKTGGRVVNGKTVLTSKEGTYYEDTKDILFKGNVDVNDPGGKIKADSLMYNMQSQGFTFIGPTNIKNKSGDVFTTQGTYNIKNGNAFFGNRSIVTDSSGRVFQANNIATDEVSGTYQLEGNAIVKDTANSVIVTGNEIFMNKKNNSFLATKKPVIILWQKKDTTYISGDTLFSGYTKRVSSDGMTRDTTGSLQDGLRKTDSSGHEMTRKTTGIGDDKTDTSIRYFIAYHHVRVFNDSLQSVSDSLFYSGADSVFRLFHDPVVWSGNSQLSGDTIYLFTKNKKADHVYVFDNGVMINKTNREFYNQVEGKTINGYFRDDKIDYVRVKGSPAESVYFLQDEKDSAFKGMNRADGSVINMYFKKQQLDQVKFLNDVHGKLYPMRQIPSDQLYLKSFTWQDKRRPKNKLELFE